MVSDGWTDQVGDAGAMRRRGTRAATTPTRDRETRASPRARPEAVQRDLRGDRHELHLERQAERELVEPHAA